MKSGTTEKNSAKEHTQLAHLITAIPIMVVIQFDVYTLIRTPVSFL